VTAKPTVPAEDVAAGSTSGLGTPPLGRPVVVLAPVVVCWTTEQLARTREQVATGPWDQPLAHYRCYHPDRPLPTPTRTGSGPVWLPWRIW
jgi:hypothetical protein